MRYVALIRGINVGDSARLPMAELRAFMVELGLGDVATYIQSGNVVFTSSDDDSGKLESEIASGIARGAGLDVAVIVRTLTEMSAAVANNPFLARAARPTELHLSFLSEAPNRDGLDGIDPAQFEPDEYRLGDRVLYFHCPFGAGRSKLVAYPWERRLGLRMTLRNWNTVTKLLAMMEAT